MPTERSSIAPKVQQALGLPEGWRTYGPFPFGGLNQQDSRPAMQDNEFFWVENFMRTGVGTYRALPDIGLPLYVAPPTKTINYFFWYNLGHSYYCMVFFTDGTAVNVNQSTGATVSVTNTPGTFCSATTPTRPYCCQYGTQYLQIVNNHQPNGYWIWDGLVLYGPGTLGPNVTLTNAGSGYVTAPTVTFFGGFGSGAAATAQIANGSVTSVTMTNPGAGYEPGDVVQVLFTGGGSDNGAELIATLAAGTVQSITVTSGGSGYTSPTITLTGGGGSGATATAVLSSGVITGITVTNAGSGYTSTPTVGISDGPGTGASAVATLSAGAVSGVTVVAGGSGFTGAPTITFSGGGGTGAAGTAVISAGAIASVTITAGGSGYTSTPTVTVGSGQNRAAQGTAALMPLGISGSSMENFQGRTWIPFPYNQSSQQHNGAQFNVSAPSSITDFASSDGGVQYTNSDRFLRASYVNIRQSNGYLYPLGDSSVSVISNVQTSGTPPVTTFVYQNTDPQIGLAWRDTCQDYSRTILMANPLGVFGIYGGAVTKTSKKLDNLFMAVVLPPAAGAVTPCAAMASVYTYTVYLILVTITDPFTGLPRTVMLGWNQGDWFVVTQAITPTFIGTQEVDSLMTAWATDGSQIVPMLNTPSATLNKTLSSKLYGTQELYITKQALAFYTQVRNNIAGQTSVSLNVTIDYENGSYPLPMEPVLPVSGNTMPVYGARSSDVYGQQLGFTLQSTNPDFSIYNAQLAYMPVAALFG